MVAHSRRPGARYGAGVHGPLVILHMHTGLCTAQCGEVQTAAYAVTYAAVLAHHRHWRGLLLDSMRSSAATGFVHANGSIDAATFQHDDRLGVDVAIYGRGPLDLDAFRRGDCPIDLAADHDFAGVDIPFHFALASDEDLAGAANRALDHPF